MYNTIFEYPIDFFYFDRIKFRIFPSYMKLDLLTHPVNAVLFNIIIVHYRLYRVSFMISIQGLMMDSMNPSRFTVSLNWICCRVVHTRTWPRIEYSPMPNIQVLPWCSLIGMN